jgi:hypothetical protein
MHALIIVDIRDLSQRLQRVLPEAMYRYHIPEETYGWVFDWVVMTGVQRVLCLKWGVTQDLVMQVTTGRFLPIDALQVLYEDELGYALECWLDQAFMDLGLTFRSDQVLKLLITTEDLIIAKRVFMRGSL